MAAQRATRRRRTNLPGREGLSASLATSLQPIHTAVRTLLKGQHEVPVPLHGLDLLFDEGVIARCRRCRVSWEVKRVWFSSLSHWACPSGCSSLEASRGECDSKP